MGGLSNVWGAAMLPFRQQDMSDWPFDVTELEPHYGAVERLVGLSGACDRLEGLYPFYATPAKAFPKSAQANWILDRMERNANGLRSRGIAFGQSRLAVSAEGCRLCQLCLTGCVYDAIYCASSTLRQLQATPGFAYLSGAKVLACRDDGTGATITFREGANGTLRTIHGRRAFVAAGVLATAGIIVHSLGLASVNLNLAFHPYFLLPMLMARNEVDAPREKLHALAQVFLEIDNPAISKSTVHAQLYSYGPLFDNRFDELGKLGSLLKSSMLGRMVALQAFLHSNEADPIKMQVDVEAGSSAARITLNGALRSGTKRVMRRVRNELARNAIFTGLAPIPLTMEIGTPGDGNHIGCVFPMSRAPRDLESDTLGRVGSMARVHAVDASVLPSIPASTITFSVMANARRIAEASLKLD
jgi:choline dehydrogenase-like flavoprotein